eukprot:306662-Chlamydomonas_euryale.AAC.2
MGCCKWSYASQVLQPGPKRSMSSAQHTGDQAGAAQEIISSKLSFAKHVMACQNTRNAVMAAVLEPIELTHALDLNDAWRFLAGVGVLAGHDPRGRTDTVKMRWQTRLCSSIHHLRPHAIRPECPAPSADLGAACPAVPMDPAAACLAVPMDPAAACPAVPMDPGTEGRRDAGSPHWER